MPLTIPATPGVARQLLISSNDLFPTPSSSIDTAINFRSAYRDIENDRVLIGGDASFCGTVADLTNPRITEFATLPSSVVATGDIDRIKPNAIDNGVLALVDRNGVKLTRTDDNGASWIDIGGGLRALAYTDMANWRGDRLIAQANSASNCDESLDNGATWPTAFSTQFSGAAGTSTHLFSDPGLNVLVNLSNTAIQVCASDDPTVPGNWTDFDLSGAGGVTNGWRSWGINDNGTKIIAIAISGAVYVSADSGGTFTRFDTDVWPLNNASGIAGSIFWCTYWPAQDGFLILDAGLTPEMGLFMPASGALDTVFPAFFMSPTGLAAPLDFNNAAASDGDNCIFVGASNQTARTIPASV